MKRLRALTLVAMTAASAALPACSSEDPSEGSSDSDIVELNIPTGAPLVYELDSELRPLKHRYLGDVAEQGKVRT